MYFLVLLLVSFSIQAFAEIESPNNGEFAMYGVCLIVFSIQIVLPVVTLAFLQHNYVYLEDLAFKKKFGALY
jgi:hypothetical protein